MKAARTTRLAFGAALFCAVAGCSTNVLYPAVRVRPSIEIDPGTAPQAGRPLLMHYTWRVASDFELPAGACGAFVHFLLPDGRLAFTDDHEPEPPLRLWKPGLVYPYARTVILPDRVRRLRVRAGLTSARFPFKARVIQLGTREPGFPALAELQIAENPDQAEEAVHAGRGFLPWVQDGRAVARSASWAGPRASFTFLQRPEGTTLFLQGYTERARFRSDPTLTLRVGPLQVGQIIRNDNRRVLRLEIPGNGSASLAEGTLETDASFAVDGHALAFRVERFRAVSRSATGP